MGHGMAGLMISSYVLLTINFARTVWGHAYLFDPPSRNIISHRSGLETCPHCLQANGPSAVKARGRGIWPTSDDPASHGLCGDPVQNSLEPMGILDMKFMKAALPQRTYVAGSVVEFKVGVSTHHWGHYEFRICDKALDESLASAEAGQTCLNTWLLERAPRNNLCGNSFAGDCQRINPRHPERWYLPPPGFVDEMATPDWEDSSGKPLHANNEVHSMRFIIPSDLVCEHCTLQWYYATGNTCAYDADYFSFDPGFKFWSHYGAAWATCDNSCCGSQATNLWGEEFWNCADIKVVSWADSKGIDRPSDVGESPIAPWQALQRQTATGQGKPSATASIRGTPTTTLSYSQTSIVLPKKGTASGTERSCHVIRWVALCCIVSMMP